MEYALEHTIGKVQENQKRLELNETNQLVVYADNVNLLDKTYEEKQ
jgi:hypothetical protein